MTLALNRSSDSAEAGLLADDRQAERLYEQLSSAGAKLIGALSEEASLAALCCKHPDDETHYLKWARARQLVEECQSKYYTCLERSDFPDAKIRSLVET
jgi:hypothetical protein